MKLTNKKKNVISTKDLPVKKSINLIGEQKKTFNAKVAIPMILVFAILIGVCGKFLVVDKLVKVYDAQTEVANLQLVKAKAFEKLNSYGDLVETYEHYTYQDMTYEEMYRADRVKVLDLIEEKVNKNNLLSLSLQENQCVIQINNVTLGMAKDIAADLKTSDLVDFCIVTNANTGSDVQYISDNQIVVAQITIYLNERGYE